MAKNNAECGKREERAIVKALQNRGYKARRQPGSGNVDPTLPHDVVWENSPIGKLLIESKWRATCGWRTLLKWMEGAPILVVKGGAVNQHSLSDPESERYVFMKFDTFMDLVGGADERNPMIDPHPADRHPMGHYAVLRVQEERERRAQIQSVHQNPPPKPMKPNKLQGRGKLPKRCEEGNHEWYLRSSGSIFCRRCGKENDDPDTGFSKRKVKADE